MLPSPSLAGGARAPRWASDAQPAPKARRVRGLKRNLQVALEELDAAVEAGHVNGGAHLTLANRLKAIHDAQAGLRKQHVQEYLIDSICECPIAAMNVPFDDIQLMHSPAFLRRLLAQKRARSSGRHIESDWMGDLMEAMLPEWAVEGKNPSYGFLRIATVVTMEARMHTLEPVERRLDKLAVAPAVLFPVDDDDGDGGPNVWEAIAAEPRVIRWLLKAGNGYTPEQVAKLRKWAIEMGDRTAELDAGWREAVALHDVLRHKLDAMLSAARNDA